MVRYNFKVLDETQRILAESHIDEVDQLAACRAIAMALATFSFTAKARASASVALEDSSGNRLAVITLLAETYGQLTCH